MTLGWTVELRRSRVANGGWEWYFTLGATRIYANEHRVGVFTDPDAKEDEAFRMLLRQWGVRG